MNEEKDIANKSANFERLDRYLEKSSASGTLLIKKWISQLDETNSKALIAVSQQLDQSKIKKVYDGLNDIERAVWSDVVKGFLSPTEINEVNKFISEEVVRDAIAPNIIGDSELIDMLLGVNLCQSILFIDKNQKMAKILLNLLTPKLAAQVLDELDRVDAENLVKESLTFDFDQVSDDFNEFKFILNKFLKDHGPKPFDNKLLQMLPNLNSKKESMIYRILIKDKSVKDIKSVAINNFPSELIHELPKDVLKAIFQDYPIDKKVILLASLDENERENFLNSFADTKSTAREMFNLEYENLTNNEFEMKKINLQKEDYWREFVEYVRKMIHTSPEIKYQLEDLVTDWITRLKSEKVPE